MSSAPVRLRLLSPFLIDFAEALGARQRDAPAYDAYWARVDRALAREATADGSPVGVRAEVRRCDAAEATTRRVRGRFNRYQQIDVDSLERPVEAIHLDIEPHRLGGIAPPPLGATVTGTRCRLYDHGVALLEVDLEVEVRGSEGLDDLQCGVVRWAEEVARSVHDDVVEPVLAVARGIVGADVVLDRRTGSGSSVVLPTVEPELGRPLWVTRSLVLRGDTDGARELARHWVKDAGVEELDRSGFSALVPQHVIRWLNYLFVLGPEGELEDSFDDEWEALRLAQYFYAAMENIDVDLGRVLALAVAERPDLSVRELQHALERSSRRAQYLTMDLADVRKYLTRAVRTEFDAILDGWDFEGAVVSPVASKAAACDQRLRELADERSSRAAFFSDTILLAIGVTSVLGTTIAVADFGRSMTVDPGMAGFDYRNESVLGWFAAQSSDLLLLGSVAVSVLLTALYLYLRRSQDQ